MCWSLFIVKLQTSKIGTLLERDSKTGIFFYEYCEIFRNTSWKTSWNTSWNSPYEYQTIYKQPTFPGIKHSSYSPRSLHSVPRSCILVLCIAVQKQFFNRLIYLTCGSVEISFLSHKKHTPVYVWKFA